MEDKEIAERLRRLPLTFEHQKMVHEIHKIADELDPPRPEPGTVVWWRYDESYPWEIAYVGKFTIECGDRSYSFSVGETKPARILAPDEVAIRKGESVRHEGKTYALVEIPDVGNWPANAVSVNAAYICENNIFREYIKSSGLDFSIPRAKAALMEMEAER